MCKAFLVRGRCIVHREREAFAEVEGAIPIGSARGSPSIGVEPAATTVSTTCVKQRVPSGTRRYSPSPCQGAAESMWSASRHICDQLRLAISQVVAQTKGRCLRGAATTSHVGRAGSAGRCRLGAACQRKSSQVASGPVPDVELQVMAVVPPASSPPHPAPSGGSLGARFGPATSKRGSRRTPPVQPHAAGDLPAECLATVTLRRLPASGVGRLGLYIAGSLRTPAQPLVLELGIDVAARQSPPRLHREGSGPKVLVPGAGALVPVDLGGLPQQRF